jgi:hypothetical protein
MGMKDTPTEKETKMRVSKFGPSRLRPMDNVHKDFRPLIDLILDGWYQPPTEKFNDNGERFYREAESILQNLVHNLTNAAPGGH